MISTALLVGDDNDAVGAYPHRPANADSVRTGQGGVGAPSTPDVDTTRPADDAALIATHNPTDTQRFVEVRFDG